MNARAATAATLPRDAGLRDTGLVPKVRDDLYDAFARQGATLVSISWEQHRLHESRRWSAVDMLAGIDLGALSESDDVCVWNAGRAELTTKPGADRVARLTDTACRRWQAEDPALASVMQAAGTWSRYWNEEEAYHETAFNTLAALRGKPIVPDETFIEMRKVFPDDDVLRTMTLLACSEITAAVNYGRCARLARDPGLSALFRQVAADEIQHMNYFVAFAKACVDSGRYAPKEAFAVGHLFVREGGEVYGSRRDRVEARGSHVNWWDQLEGWDDVESAAEIDRQVGLIFVALERITGIRVKSAEEVEDTWMDLVGT